MKKILLLLMFVPTLLFSQEEEIFSFSVQDGNLIWQKIYETELSFDDVVSNIRQSGAIPNAEVTDDKIIGQTRLIDADIKGAGYKPFSVAIYINRNFYECFATIEYKEGRYRVTLKNITMIQKYDDPMGVEGQRERIELYTIGGDGMKRSFVKKPAEILDYTFTKLFTIKEQPNDDW